MNQTGTPIARRALLLLPLPAFLRPGRAGATLPAPPSLPGATPAGGRWRGLGQIRVYGGRRTGRHRMWTFR